VTSPSQAETVRRVLEQDRADLHVCLPGKVRSYNQEAQTAEIELGIRRVVPAPDDDDPDDVRDYPILPAVPVLCLSGGGYFAHFPLSVGDRVLVLFAESDLNEWRRTGDTCDPGLSTRHGLSGAVCIPGIHYQGNALSIEDTGAEPRLTIGRVGGPQIHVNESQIECGGTLSLALGNDVRAHLTKISADLVTVFAAATAGTPTYNYVTEIAANPINTDTVKGA
jgi:hypothetical protein